MPKKSNNSVNIRQGKAPSKTGGVRSMPTAKTKGASKPSGYLRTGH